MITTNIDRLFLFPGPGSAFRIHHDPDRRLRDGRDRLRLVLLPRLIPTHLPARVLGEEPHQGNFFRNFGIDLN